MIKLIANNLFVGTVEVIPHAQQLGFSILGCCKDPLHRKHARLQGASEDGYVGKAMPSTEREYLFAERDHALYLNLIDPKDMKYIPDEVINKGLDFIDKELAEDRSVLIACNKAESRSPSIAFMYMIQKGFFDICLHNSVNCQYTIEDDFRDIYPNYNPREGMKDYVKKFWEDYKNGKET